MSLCEIVAPVRNTGCTNVSLLSKLDVAISTPFSVKFPSVKPLRMTIWGDGGDQPRVSQHQNRRVCYSFPSAHCSTGFVSDLFQRNDFSQIHHTFCHDCHQFFGDISILTLYKGALGANKRFSESRWPLLAESSPAIRLQPVNFPRR